MTAPLRASLFGLAFALMASLPVSIAHADVVPEGQTYIPVEHTLTGVANANGYTLLLVTVNGRDRQQADVVPVTADGPLPVPSGYMNRSHLVALTPAQVKEMEALRAAPLAPSPERDDSPLRKFFMREDVAASDELYFRGLVPEGSESKRILVAWNLTGVDKNKIVLAGSETHFDAAGQPLERGASGFPLVLVLGFGAVIVATGVFIFLRRKTP